MSTTTFTVTFACESAAFEGEELYTEVGRILRHIGGFIAVTELRGPVYDINGNRIGSYGLEEVETC